MDQVAQRKHFPSVLETCAFDGFSAETAKELPCDLKWNNRRGDDRQLLQELSPRFDITSHVNVIHSGARFT